MQIELCKNVGSQRQQRLAQGISLQIEFLEWHGYIVLYKLIIACDFWCSQCSLKRIAAISFSACDKGISPPTFGINLNNGSIHVHYGHFLLLCIPTTALLTLWVGLTDWLRVVYIIWALCLIKNLDMPLLFASFTPHFSLPILHCRRLRRKV